MGTWGREGRVGKNGGDDIALLQLLRTGNEGGRWRSDSYNMKKIFTCVPGSSSSGPGTGGEQSKWREDSLFFYVEHTVALQFGEAWTEHGTGRHSSKCQNTVFCIILWEDSQRMMLHKQAQPMLSRSCEAIVVPNGCKLLPKHMWGRPPDCQEIWEFDWRDSTVL